MKVLVVDDDRVLADLVAFTFRRKGFQVSLAHDGEAALQCWTEEQPDLIVLDVNMPKLDGFAVCRYIREQADTPVVLLTVQGEEEDIIHGLELGADDYITKPFSPRQLVARAQAILRRAGKTPTSAVRQVGELRLDPSRREMRIGEGQAVSLGLLESRLLDYLMLNAGQILTAEAIINHVWGSDGGDRDTLHQLVYRLRVKMARACGLDADELDLSSAAYIETVPGLGYNLAISSLTDHSFPVIKGS